MADKRKLAEAHARKYAQSSEAERFMRLGFLAGFDAGAQQMRERAAKAAGCECSSHDWAEGEEISCPQERARALPLDPKEAQDAEG